MILALERGRILAHRFWLVLESRLMMKRLIVTAAVFLSLLMPIGFYGEVDNYFSIAQSVNLPTAETDVKLVVPDQVQPGQLVQIMVTGLTEDKLNSAIVDWEPQEGVIVIPAKTWGGQPMILFQPPSKNSAKSYALWIAWPYSQGDKINQGYTKVRVQVGDADPFPDPTPNPKPVNPFPKPNETWLKTLEPLSKAIKQSNLQFLKAKQAAEKLESLAAQIAADALTDSAQLFQAIAQAGQGSGLGKDVATALGKVMEVQNPHDKRIDMDQAAWTLRYMAWTLWDSSILETEIK